MNILYLSFYFEPDLCAGSFRNTPLIKQLANKIKGNGRVDLQTTMPNRYHSFAENANESETIKNLDVTRVQLPPHQSGFKDQIFSFKAFYEQVLKNTKNKKYDLVVASSSRLFTAYLGYKIAKKQNIPLYLDIRDIFVDTMNDVLNNGVVKKMALPIIKKIEQKTFSYASHINLISEGFKPYFTEYKNASYSFFPNGIDQEFTQIRTNKNLDPEKITITYAGNIGEGQGLHKILPAAAKALGNNYQFKIIGDGGLKTLFQQTIKELKVNNIELLQPVKRAELIEHYKNSDFLFLHLNDYEAFKKVLPSKIFEYGASDKPIIAGVSGYASKFIQENLTNYILFSPIDVDSFVEQMKKFKHKFEIREKFIIEYSRENVNEKIVDSILKILS